MCAIYGMRFTGMNCLWLGNTKETVSQIKVCVIEGIRFRRINCLHLGNRTETGKPDQSVCDWWHKLHTDELFAIGAMSWHHAKFHDFQACFGFTGIKKTNFLNLYGQATTPRCLNFIPISCMGPRNSPEDTHVIFQSTLVHGSMCL